MEKKIKWGILGTGGIASVFAKDLTFAKNTERTAVGSRTKGSATKFAEDHDVSRAYGSYEELLQDSDVDAIYVAMPSRARHLT